MKTTQKKVFNAIICLIVLTIWAYGYGKDSAMRERRHNNVNINSTL